LFSTIGVSQVWGKWRTKPAMVAYTNASGQLDAGQIRGWMTLADISGGYHIPLPRLYAASHLPAKVDPATRLNRVARNYQLEFEPDAMREVVAGFLQRPGSQAQSKAQAKDHPHGDGEVKGFMTLNEIASKTGVTTDFLLRWLKITGPIDPRLPVREWMHSKDKSIQDIRDAVTQYRGQTPATPR
jgi:hypothetical protein